MCRYALAALLLFSVVTSVDAHAETIKPIKASRSDLAGAIFNRADAVKNDQGGETSADVATFTSTDNAYQTGVYRSGLHTRKSRGRTGCRTTSSCTFFQAA